MKRLLLWTFRCQLGRRCADVEFHDLYTTVPGSSIHVGFRCPGCGTEYEASALMGRDGSFVSGGRIRA